ncbi:Uncharacterized protein Rs2_41739 [Raphanus sativus]|nr:Uncharacterized protein Rs2_41739 [Raphanus sativus]
MASDGKTEKDVSADSTTSLLSEEVCVGFHLFWTVCSARMGWKGRTKKPTPRIKEVGTQKKLSLLLSELLALSERIGTVITGLTEEDVKSHLKTRTCSVINRAEESPKLKIKLNLAPYVR